MDHSTPILLTFTDNSTPILLAFTDDSTPILLAFKSRHFGTLLLHEYRFKVQKFIATPIEIRHIGGTEMG